MEWKYVFMTFLGVIGLFLIGTAVFKPVKLLVKVGMCFLTGLLLIFGLNLLLKMVGMHIGMNPFTVLVAGFLHVPGVILLVLLNYMFI